MAYSLSLRTLRKIEPRLTSLARGVGTSWRTATPQEAQRFAYKVREALYIATLNSGAFPALARAHSLFRIQVNGNIVQAIPVGGLPVEQQPADMPTPSNLTPSAPVEADLTCIGPESVADVVQFWLDAQPTNASISVVEAILTNGELAELEQWASGLQPPWQLIHVPGEAHFTIRPSAARKFTGASSPLRSARPTESLNPEDPHNVA